MSVISTLKDLLKLGYPQVGTNGNLEAQVTPRSAPLATLLAVSDAGIGEVAHPTDADCLVVYEDDGGGDSLGRVLPKSNVREVITMTQPSNFAVATGAGERLDLGAIVDPYGRITANHDIYIPESLGDPTKRCDVLITVEQKITDWKDATYANLSLEGASTSGGTFGSFWSYSDLNIVKSELLADGYFRRTILARNNSVPNSKYMRVWCDHDATSDLVTVAISPAYWTLTIIDPYLTAP